MIRGWWFVMGMGEAADAMFEMHVYDMASRNAMHAIRSRPNKLRRLDGFIVIFLGEGWSGWLRPFVGASELFGAAAPPANEEMKAGV